MAARVKIQPADETWLVGEERPCGCFVEWFDVACDRHRFTGPRILCRDCEFVLLGVAHICNGNSV